MSVPASFPTLLTEPYDRTWVCGQHCTCGLAEESRFLASAASWLLTLLYL